MSVFWAPLLYIAMFAALGLSDTTSFFHVCVRENDCLVGWVSLLGMVIAAMILLLVNWGFLGMLPLASSGFTILIPLVLDGVGTFG